MAGKVILTGMVLSAMPVGDYDKRITLLTRERGKIVAFARGARRPNSALLAACAPFAFGSFELYEGKSAYTLVKAEISNYFRTLTAELEHTYYGFYFLEIAEYYSQENVEAKELLLLLYQSLKAIENPSLSNPLIRCIFELRVLVIEGIYPEVFRCKLCGGQENLHLFSVAREGVLCDECVGKETGISICESTLYTLQYIVSSDLKKLYTFAVSEAVLQELKLILQRYYDKVVCHKFNSAAFLELLVTV